MEVEETLLIEGLQKRDETAFEQVFKTYFKSLRAYAFAILQDETAAEEMVQNVFYKLWERTDHISIPSSLAAYLYRAVHNESLNFLKHLKVRSRHRLYVSHRMQEGEEPALQLHAKELDAGLRKALNQLPEQCRTIFQMSRFENLRYREIAGRLDISVKTVENQMSKALRILREKLSGFLMVVFLFINIKP